MIDARGHTRRALRWSAGAALLGAQLWLTASVAYLLALLVAGARRRPAGPPSPAGTPPVIVALVPAHDEERGVTPVVHALVDQDYPPARLAVIVIADNCTDGTAGVAARAGATVWRRDEPDARGKGHALGWALARLRHERPDADIVLVVDADCLASPNLCRAIAATLGDRSVEAVQARYEVSNPEASPTAALRAAGFILKHVVRSRGRSRLGLSCGLFGSGMAFRSSLFHRVAWPTSVTEDTELHVRLVQQGVAVRYVDDASVSSPMPTTAAAAVDQQMRWETGNAQMATRHALGLATRGLRSRDVQLLAAAAELLVPSQSMLAAGSLGLGCAGLVLGHRRATGLAWATLAGQAGYILGGLAAAGAPAASIRALAHAPGFVAARLRVHADIARGRGADTWVRTTRES